MMDMIILISIIFTLVYPFAAASFLLRLPLHIIGFSYASKTKNQ